ncbi:beta-microseminoprotein-like [Corapipo altera]|uniref:beta-microseminoprotein-like n=1 Tax=Corapipo altera TaxID=415028 RepID=UPI000FD67299|nr:beta-microseminoprotein-like [Corapipo altera]XP_027488366.1 beta-microseminoprotein-like [Corapipo altera]
MKSFLAFLLAMGIIVALGDAYCFTKHYKPGKAYKGCMLNGKLYPLGHIERTEDCYRCDCSRTEMRCCSIFLTPIQYDKENCKVTLNKKSCTYDVVQKNDPSKECSPVARVG